MTKKKKRVLLLAALGAALVFGLLCWVYSTGDAAVSYGPSELYSQLEIRWNAKTAVRKTKGFTDCTLTRVAYAGDAQCKRAKASYATSSNYGGYDAIMVIYTDFHTGAYPSGFEPDEDYTDWQWIFGKSKFGVWTLINAGYA